MAIKIGTDFDIIRRKNRLNAVILLILNGLHFGLLLISGPVTVPVAAVSAAAFVLLGILIALNAHKRLAKPVMICLVTGASLHLIIHADLRQTWNGFLFLWFSIAISSLYQKYSVVWIATVLTVVSQIYLYEWSRLIPPLPKDEGEIVYYVIFTIFVGAYFSVFIKHINSLQKKTKIRLSELDRMRILFDADLGIAVRTQKLFLPAALEKISGFENDFFYRSSGGIGTILYHMIKHEDGSFPAILLDIPGSGPSAALILSYLSTLFQSASSRNTDPAEIARSLNSGLNQTLKGSITVCGAIFTINPGRRDVLSVSAGVPGLTLIRPGSSRPIEPVDSVNPKLGESALSEYRVRHWRPETGDIILAASTAFHGSVTSTRVQDDGLNIGAQKSLTELFNSWFPDSPEDGKTQRDTAVMLFRAR